ncbi:MULTISPECIES: hypothetical protein [unclassified Nostoc]|uniref:hypothetical protein n=1 Tax=unclassified Nostoc TaxID=2593658 RepID=UPI0025FA5961|nr:hypothetical protein [Nostoc sp. JL31]MBN3889823.1 hypothetical protein [Nostoc sp. JL31]
MSHDIVRDFQEINYPNKRRRIRKASVCDTLRERRESATLRDTPKAKPQATTEAQRTQREFLRQFWDIFYLEVF